mgnify:CR=1 FL=1
MTRVPALFVVAVGLPVIATAIAIARPPAASAAAGEGAEMCARNIADLSGTAAIPAGAYTMGSDSWYPEESPAREAQVAAFDIDQHEVTNGQFAEFVAATGYVTLAERTPDPADFPDIDPDALVAGSAVFVAGKGPQDAGQWRFVPGASWRAPMGPGSTLEGREEYPVVHVAYEDAAAYAAWRGRRLPGEAEWERAARAGLDRATYEWGSELAPEGEWRANTWQGTFPLTDRGEDGFIGAAPAACYEPSEYGLYDMTGNVWEWTADDYFGDPARAVVKGGSFLCAESYCARYRPAARQPYERNFSASHLGFRTAGDVPAEAASGS